MLAYPFSQRYQNSNQCLLETYAAANAGGSAAGGRRGAQDWLRQAGYRPITLDIGALTRLGARITRVNIGFDDHPFEHRMAGRIDTVTVDSVLRFVRRHDPDSRRLHIALGGVK